MVTAIAVTPNKQEVIGTTAVRRSKNDGSWREVDDDREWFKKDRDGFTSGIITDVLFVHKAPPMKCVPGYESTGEMIGVLTRIHKPKIPNDVVRTLSITYDRERRLFHELGNPDNIIDKADYLLLTPNGTVGGSIIAGWKN